MKSIIIIILGFFLLIKGADILVYGSSRIAKKFNIPDIIVGLTIVSIGTSIPELMISIKSVLSGYSDMSIGNVFGSCICNILLILGASSLFSKIPIDEESRNVVLPLTLLSMVIILIFGNMNMEISRLEGLMLLGIFSIFILYLTVCMLKIDNFRKMNIENDDKIEKEIRRSTKKRKYNKGSYIKDILYIILGIIGLKFGGDFVVEEAKNIARYFNISESIIGLTIVSIGTSLPELVTSVVASFKGNGSIAFGNIIGSNLFNLLLVLGISSLIHPIKYSGEFNFSLILLILITILILIFDSIGEKRYLTKIKGIAMLLMYVEYIFLLITV